MTIDEWKKDFEEYVNELSLSRDDYRPIIEYINEGYAILQSSKEPVAPIVKWVDGWTEYYCGNCKRYLFFDEEDMRYMIDRPKCCPECGQAVKWDD